ncbi:MAG: F0F1 ATP synthase subunit delta, partial [Alphaproteobacteria bacterium]
GLSDAQMANLQKQLRAGIGRDVKINFSIDESLLGGLVVKVGSRQIDSSLASKLNRLRIAMKGAG